MFSRSPFIGTPTPIPFSMHTSPKNGPKIGETALKGSAQLASGDAFAAGQVFSSLASIASVVLIAHRMDGTGGH